MIQVPIEIAEACTNGRVQELRVAAVREFEASRRSRDKQRAEPHLRSGGAQLLLATAVPIVGRYPGWPHRSLRLPAEYAKTVSIIAISAIAIFSK